MITHKKIKVGNRYIEALSMHLSKKNLVVLKGRKGFIMCGYLNLKAAEKSKDAAAKITGISTIKQALKTTVRSCTTSAQKIGIRKGQSVKDALLFLA